MPIISHDRVLSICLWILAPTMNLRLKDLASSMTLNPFAGTYWTRPRSLSFESVKALTTWNNQSVNCDFVGRLLLFQEMHLEMINAFRYHMLHLCQHCKK
ncbi:unnamed protein product [Musa textilis]